MEKQKKQIILAVVLGVVALGMGSYFVLTRDRVDPNRGRAAASGPQQRQVRAVTETKKPERKKRAAKRTQDDPKVAERQTRERTEQKGDKRRSARRGGAEKIKKKESKPAA